MWEKGLKSQFCSPFIFPITIHMHILQSKHTKLKTEEVKKLLEEYNISLSQLPKIKSTDAALPEGSIPGEVFKIERKEDDKINVYYRVVA